MEYRELNLIVSPSNTEIGLSWYKKGTNHAITYLEIILIIASMIYIVDLRAYELHPRDEKISTTY